MFGAGNYRAAGEVGLSPAGALLNSCLKPENAFTAGHGDQLREEAEKAKQIAC